MVRRTLPMALAVVLSLGAVAASAQVAEQKPAPAPESSGRYYLVPGLAEGATHLAAGRRQFTRRVALSPAVGRLGQDDLFAVRLAFNPNPWLGYEISLAHNPAASVHAMLHTFSLQLRYPVSGRIQPYASAGYGMITVYPGQAIKADPVTKNVLAAGGGLEFYVRDDVALRGELRSAFIIGQYRGQDVSVTYNYQEYTIGLVFYRGLGS